MKHYISLAILTVSSFAANAQNPAGLSQEEMQQMLQAAQAMQTCLQQIDPATMERLRSQSMQLSTDIKTLCTDGKRDAAQDKALAFAKQTAKDPAMQTLIECGRQMHGKYPQLQQLAYADIERELADRHVCDMQ